ncbi:hypothetical protein [Deinococcus pimensis]|uniref:hypothetical protein n=1 Tax=Deinococcus pimensis TaxID=309888 RepID=UPI00048279B8|nr:hypothetical protein [Deinococcus pimensis]
MTTWRFLEDAGGWDLIWFAVDDDGHVAAVTTAGFTLLPDFVTSIDLFNDLFDVVEKLPGRGNARAMQDLDEALRYDSWEDLAVRGLYTYDMEQDDGDGPTRLVLRAVYFPSTALHLIDLPQNARDLLEACRLPGVLFASTPVLRVDEPPR